LVLRRSRDETDHEFVYAPIEFSPEAQFGSERFDHLEKMWCVQQRYEGADDPLAGPLDELGGEAALLIGHVGEIEQGEACGLLVVVIG
jgi:hypothetical protein